MPKMHLLQEIISPKKKDETPKNIVLCGLGNRESDGICEQCLGIWERRERHDAQDVFDQLCAAFSCSDPKTLVYKSFQMKSDLSDARRKLSVLDKETALASESLDGLVSWYVQWRSRSMLRKLLDIVMGRMPAIR